MNIKKDIDEIDLNLDIDLDSKDKKTASRDRTSVKAWLVKSRKKPNTLPLNKEIVVTFTEADYSGEHKYAFAKKERSGLLIKCIIEPNVDLKSHICGVSYPLSLSPTAVASLEDFLDATSSNTSLLDRKFKVRRTKKGVSWDEVVDDADKASE